jgi:hypothetical protein
MQFKTGQTVVRHDPGEHEVTFSIQGPKDVAYHEELAAKGYRYTDITKGTADEFDLPSVPAAAITKPKVHIASEAVCTACEG